MNKNCFPANFEKTIEGLRCFSVLAVLIFHIVPEALPGGFIGVDLFFIISGYLISRNIINSYQRGDFSFKNFYLRRFRRLYPALLGTVALCFVLSLVFLSSRDFADFSRSGLASLFGLSNFYFYFAVDYFNSDALAHPLLHTWSLGLEEQFYLLWPLLVVSCLIFFKSVKKTFWALLGLSTVSFIGMLLVSTKDVDAVFYLMPFRAFQFSLGFVALYFKEKIEGFFKERNFLAHLFFALGLLGVFYSVFFFSEAVLWPGYSSLIPTISLMMILLVGDIFVGRLIFENRLSLLIGRISYSLYLVHWPVVVFYRKWSVVPPTLIDKFMMFVLSIGLGWLFYKVFEQRFSSKGKAHESAPLKVKKIFICFCLLFASLAAASFSRSSSKNLSALAGLCYFSRSVCEIGDVSAEKQIFLVGDSHALSLVYGLNDFLKERKIKAKVIYDQGCLFLKNSPTYYRGMIDKRCLANVDYAFDLIRESSAPVILVSNYAGYRYRLGEVFPYQEDYEKRLWKRLHETLEYISTNEKKILVFSSSYNTGVDLNKCSSGLVRSDSCVPDGYFKTYAKVKPYDDVVFSVCSLFEGAQMFNPKSAFCSNKKCTAYSKDGELLLKDKTHLTDKGSTIFFEQTEGFFSEWLEKAL